MTDDLRALAFDRIRRRRNLVTHVTAQAAATVILRREVTRL
jgi:hypothetical protein